MTKRPTLVSTRLSEHDLERLERKATELDRSKAYIINTAVKKWLDEQEEPK